MNPYPAPVVDGAIRSMPIRCGFCYHPVGWAVVLPGGVIRVDSVMSHAALSKMVRAGSTAVTQPDGQYLDFICAKQKHWVRLEDDQVQEVARAAIAGRPRYVLPKRPPPAAGTGQAGPFILGTGTTVTLKE